MVIIVVGLVEIITTPAAFAGWTSTLAAGGGGFTDPAVPAIVAFPLLVLGLSGFEPGFP